MCQRITDTWRQLTPAFLFSVSADLEEPRWRAFRRAAKAGKNVHGQDCRTLWEKIRGNVHWVTGESPNGSAFVATSRRGHQPTEHTQPAKPYVHDDPSKNPIYGIIANAPGPQPCNAEYELLYITNHMIDIIKLNIWIHVLLADLFIHSLLWCIYLVYVHECIEEFVLVKQCSSSTN